MPKENIELDYLPDLENPLFIAGFDGWGNALGLSWGMIDYIIRKLHAKPFGKINPDFFYRFDEKRPQVDIENGILKSVEPAGGTFYEVSRNIAGRDIIILKASEPHLKWFYFIETILSLCRKARVKSIISLGSMYDNVLHTDTVISALASSEEALATLADKDVMPISYKGPGAIHSTIHSEALALGFDCLSLWCHCPYYLQGTTHFGLLSHLGNLLSECGEFRLETEELKTTWLELCKQIQEIIDKNPELQGRIDDLRKAKVRGPWQVSRKKDKIIRFEDFLKPK